jgi:hypothetical protein
MKTAFAVKVLLCILLSFCTTYSISQKGFIYQQATNATARGVLDPNGDGYTSLTTSGFSGTDDILTNSELQTVSLPVLFGETFGDLSTGASGGHTDLVSHTVTNTHSVSVVVKTVGGIQYLIVRFRIGKASTASKGYSLLIDSDNSFGTYLTSNNPGYDREIILETGNPGSIKIYKHSTSGDGGVGQVLATYNAAEYSQRSIAATTNNSDADYFYDFCVPLSAVQAENAVRITAATITSAQSGITGTVSDFNGVGVYANPFQAMKDIINTFPTGVKFTDIVPGFTFSLPLTVAPVVTNGLSAGGGTITGTSTEANATGIRVYRRRNGTNESIGTTTVTSNQWTLSSLGASVLQFGDLVWAKAKASGRDSSSASNEVFVSAAACYTPPPVIQSRQNGQLTLTITWTEPNNLTYTASDVQIRVYNTATNAEVIQSGGAAQYINPATGSVTFDCGGTFANQSAFSPVSLYATATYKNCTSRYGNVIVATGSTLTPPPIMVTTSIEASNTTGRTVQVTSNSGTGSTSTLYLYMNSALIATQTGVAHGTTHSFQYTGFVKDAIVSARALRTDINTYVLSNRSDSVKVTATVSTSAAPTISGSYISGTGKTVTGYSDEAPGTTIYLYSNGTLIGTGTVNAFGGWSITGMTLTANQSITAKALAPDKLLSAASIGITVLDGTVSAPTAPTITTNPIVVGSTSSISGSMTSITNGTIYIYLDGEEIGNVAASATTSWTINLTATQQSLLTKGSVITAKAKDNTSGLTSSASAGVTVTGVSNFLIKSETGNSTIPSQTAGVQFKIDINAVDGSNATVTSYKGTNNLVGTYSITSGSTTGSFSSGFLDDHTVTLNKAGTYTLKTLSAADPTVIGTSNSFSVVHNTASKLLINTQPSVQNTSNTAFGTQPIIYLTDAYDNVITEDNSTQITVTIASGTNGTLGGTVTKTAVNGIITFSDLKITGGGRFTLRFADAGNLYSSVTSDNLYIGEVWTGTTSTSFTTGSNWADGTSPSSGADIAFDLTPSNHLILTANQTIGSFYNSSNKQLQVNGNKLTVTGLFTQPSGATIEASTSEIEMAGTAAQTVPVGTFVDDKVCKFTVNNTSGVTLQDTLIITCRITPTAGTLTTGGVLVLGSDATKDAVVASGSGTISGKVIVERYIPAKRAWRILTSPLKNTGRFYNNWQNGGSYIPGIGTLVSGPTAGQSVNGLDVTTQQNTSLFTYNGTTNAWDAVTNTLNFNLSDSASSAASKGYLIFIRGDRDPSNAVVGAYNQTTLRATGELQSGDQTYTINAATNKFNLIANPYACPIDLNAMYLDNSTKINRKFWYYDPKGPDLGQYVTVTWNAVANQYDIVPGDQPYQTRYIQNGQAFFVQTITGGIADPLNANITIKETHKSPDNVYLVYRSGSQLERMRIYLRGVNNDGSRDRLDGVLANFHNSYSAGIGDEDASKFLNFNESLSLRRNGRSLSIEGRPLMSAGDTLFLYLNSLKVKNYEFSIEPSSFSAPGLEAYLEDAFLNTSTALSLSNTTTVQFSVTSNAQSSAATRFRIVFRQSGVLPVTFNNIKAYSKDNKQVNVDWSVSNESGIIEYNVERSVDGRTFNQIGSVKAKNVTDYSFTDQNPVAGVNFYRVKSAGVNGEAKYTSIAKVSLGDKNSYVQVYPNPATGGNINLQLNNLKQGIYTINVMNAVGQIVFSSQVNHAGGSSSQLISINGIISKGVYQLNVIGAGSRQTQRFVIE